MTAASIPETASPVLARLLGIHITVAVAWQRASAGDWAAYAAEVSRRTPADKPPESPTQPKDRRS